MGLSESDFELLRDRVAANLRGCGQSEAPKPLPRTPRRGRMNKWERLYSGTLEARRMAGDVLWYEFEGWKCRLADGAWYTPDFMVATPCGIEFHEVKGFWREAARVRIKVAADKYAFPFFAVRRQQNGEWAVELIKGRR